LLPTGTIVAGYRIDGELGEGGMSVVYRATQLSLDRVVALKLLAGDLSNDPGFRARFQREGQLQATLDHQHIVPVYEAGQTEHGLFLAMRLIRGPTLKHLILDGELDPRRSLRLLAQVAQALDAAHAQGLIHRDIKPQNILIGEGDHAYLADFGLIKAPDEARLTGTGQFIGTIDYVAPEQIQGEPATAASDIYALTGVLCECLTGQVPFPKPNEAATVHAHVMAPPPRVTERRPELPAALDEVIAAGMAKEPEARPSSATELIRAASRAFGSGSGQSIPASQGTRLSSVPVVDERPQARYVPGAATTVKAAALPAAGATRLAGSPTDLQSPADAPTKVARRRSAPRAVLAIVGALAAAALAAGYLVGHTGSRQTASAFVNAATLGNLGLRYPAGWQLGATEADIPGVTFSNPLVLTPPQANAALTAGEVADARGTTLLSSSLRARIEGPLPAPDTVRIGALEAYRYSGLRIRGIDGALTLFAIPTTAGVATVTCWASPSGPRGFQGECAQIADTLRLVAATAYPLGPSPAYADALSATFKSLSSAVSGPTAALRAATTPTAQAAAARNLAAAYRRAATVLSAAKPSPAEQVVNGALTASLHQLAAGYAGAAGAAASDDAAAYSRAAKRIDAGSAALSSALGALRKQGYDDS
jgi:serine/threonine-protein kinase